jgi:hypothetical protein
MIAAVLAMFVFAGVWLVKAIRDDNLDALDEEAAQAWERGQ